MKRILKIMLVLVALAVLGCSSSKDVMKIPGAPLPDDSISVKFIIDKDSYTDMPANGYIQMVLKEDDPGMDPAVIAIGQRYSLKRDTTYTLTGYYINNSNLAVAFPQDGFSLRIYGQDIKSMTAIRHEQRLILQID